jgi:glutaredoxin
LSISGFYSGDLPAGRAEPFVPNSAALRALFACHEPWGQGYNLVVQEPRKVVVYSRKGCHLCEVVKESLEKLSRRGSFTWQEVDVDSDGELRRQFNDEVPVVFINGRKAFKYRMDEQEFLRKLAS